MLCHGLPSGSCAFPRHSTHTLARFAQRLRARPADRTTTATRALDTAVPSTCTHQHSISWRTTPPPTAPDTRQLVCRAARSAKRLKYERSQQLAEPVLLAVQPDGSDVWRLEPIVELLKAGGVGIIPTDTLPAFVCDINNPAAVRRMCSIKDINPKKPLSILCRNLSAISLYTLGIPASTVPGQPDLYRYVRKVLPGPYTLILPASKNLPRMCIDTLRGTTKHRTSVGVRWPNNPICQALLDGFGSPLLCTSVHMDPVHSINDTTEVPDTGTLLELYGNRGIDFLLDVPSYVATASTVIDLTGPVPELVRQGKGDASLFVAA